MQLQQLGKLDYHHKITAAMDYIQRHLLAQQGQQADLSLARVAAASNMSAFHFHRVFKQVVGETFAEYVRRLKLEWAAALFFYRPTMPVTEVALLLGFSSSQNLAKAFKLHFKVTPSAIKKLPNQAALTTLIGQQSKIGNINGKSGNVLDAIERYASGSTDVTLTTLEANTMQTTTFEQSSAHTTQFRLVVEQFEPRKIIYKRLIGPYGLGVAEASAALNQYVIPHEIAVAEPVSVIWDNPQITAADKCRTDVGITLKQDLKQAKPFSIQTLSGGKYGYVRAVLSQQQDYINGWQQLFSQIEQQGYQLDAQPCYKILHLESSTPQQGVFDVSFCAPLLVNNA